MVTLVALLPRLFVAIAWSREPVWDGHYYHFGAARIAEGLGYSEDVMIGGYPVWKAWCHYPVGYSGLLGGLYALFGPGLLIAPIANAVIGTAQVGVAHRLARSFLGVNRARIGAALIALHPGLIAYSALVMNELLSGLLLLVTAAILLKLRGRLALGGLLGGLTLGLATLVRPSILFSAPFTALLSPSRGTKLRSLLRALVLGVGCTAAAVLTVLPWSLRNCERMDACAFVSTNGGWNLAIGALTETGRFRTLTAQDGCPMVTGQVQQDRCWRDVGRARISADPAAWLALIPKKLGHTYDHESFAVEYLHEANPSAWPEPRRAAGRALLSNFHRALLVVAALCLVGWPRRRELYSTGKWYAAWGCQVALLGVLLALTLQAVLTVEHPFFWLPALMPLIALIPLPGRPRQGAVGRFLLSAVFTTSLTHAVFFGDDRYHLVVSPALCLLAAAALRPSAPRGV